MFTSFLIPSVFEGVHARHLCVFYAQLQAFGRDQVSFVGEPAYFEPPAALAAAGRPEWSPSWRAAYDYQPPADLAGVVYEALPGDLLTPRLERLGSSWKLYGQLLTKRLPEVEAALDQALQTLDSRRRLEAVIAFANNPSLSHVARMRQLPVVHSEYGPLRPPDYVMTGYWDRSGVSWGSDAARRYRAFRRASIGARVPLLEREELLAVLRRTPLPEAPPAEDRYRVGIALQGDDNACVHGVNALDLLSMARRQFAPGQILLRYHSGSLTRVAETMAVIDDSSSPTAFIQQCDTVLTVSSGTALEALLLGRRAVVVGDSPFALAAERRLDGRSRASSEAERLRILNFLVFGYLVPGALMFDASYLRWRLTDPSELAIYRHHQRWYRTRLLEQPLPHHPQRSVVAAGKLLDAVPNGDAPIPLVLFGAGAATPMLAAQLQPQRFALEAIFDNDAARWGSSLAGVPIERPVCRAGTSVLVASVTHADAIVGQLRALGYPAERVLRLR